jgi:hypothetical protein
MNVCLYCWNQYEENGWKLASSDKQVLSADRCEVHPSMKNWRVIRTLRSINFWSQQDASYRNPNSGSLQIAFPDECVSTVAALKILFDYEQPFIHFWIDQKYLQLKCIKDGPFDEREVVYLTPKGKEFVAALPPEE